MRRPLACLALAAVVMASTVAPVHADDPVASGPPSDPPAAAPSATPSPEPTPAPAEPTPTATPAPSGDPAPSPSADPEPDASATPAVEPDAGPPAEAPAQPPAEAEPDPTPDPEIPEGAPDPTDRYIVMLKPSADPVAVAAKHEQRDDVQMIRSFKRSVKGFSAKLDEEQHDALLADPSVVAVVPDEIIQVTAQTIPNGIRRVGTRSSSAAAINGLDGRVDADIAIVDTGIAQVPDLNVVGGYNCSTSDRTAWRDREGHGTHVAGTAAAIDNDFGVVGVAPGARLWAVKILNDDGYGLLSWYVCGLDWILAQRDPNDPGRPLFEAVNMSVAKSGADDGVCGTSNNDVLHAAICRVVAGKITVVAAAANASASATRYVPAAYNEVITVSALADTDGKAGGVGPRAKCYSWGGYDKDDTFADFSNYGHDVDLIAPGKCIWSTLRDGSFGYMSGTSMAAPTVTGAVALYKASRPDATPAEVKEALQHLGNLGWNTATDPDTRHEKLLDVSKVAKLGSFGFAAHEPATGPDERGGTVTVPVEITRTSSFFERVRFSVVSVPSGWSASFATTSLMGFTAKKADLRVTVPASTPRGTYNVRVAGTHWGRRVEATIPVVVGNDVPTAKAPLVAATSGYTVGVSRTIPTTLSMKVTWPAATDASSPIAGYELQRRVDGGAWGGTVATSGSVRSAIVGSLKLTSIHEFRVRARDSAGNWSAWKAATPQSFVSYSDRSKAVRYDGRWSRASTSSSTHGVRTTSTQAGAAARFDFTGRGVALIMPRSRVRGKVSIYIDGKYRTTVDTYSSSTQSRRVVFATSWTTPGKHRITVRVSGTRGRPTVSIDGYVVLK